MLQAWRQQAGDGEAAGLAVFGLWLSAELAIALAAWLRVVGAIALSLCYVAAGRFDAMLSTRTCRSVDAAAGQLIAREAGASAALEELALDEADLGLDARYRVTAAATGEWQATVREALGLSPTRDPGLQTRARCYPAEVT